MLSLCGLDCCAACPQRAACGGCRETQGHPFGGTCVAAACVERGGMEAWESWKHAAMAELNALCIPDLQIDSLVPLNGFYVNLEYRLPNGQAVSSCWRTTRSTWALRSSAPIRSAAMASSRTKHICWCASTAVTVRTRRSSAINEGGRQNENHSNLPQMRRA